VSVNRPSSGKRRLTYKDYLNLDELLKLQKLRSKPRQHDEVLFIIAHQTYELWFKLMLNELELAVSFMISNDPARATRLIRRVVTVQKVLIQQLEVLETIRPTDFMKFRSILRPASGFQSLQFRELEFISGMKDERFLKLHQKDESSYEQLLKRFEAPSMWDGFLTLLEHRGYYKPSPKTERGNAVQRQIIAISRIFKEARDEQLTELTEALMDYDKHFWLWRNHHLAMVERVIGGRRGTGYADVKTVIGAESFEPSGVSYLRTTLAKRFFPALWEARSRIGG
jgi:tryptophan 2,3-dioxygenase